MEKIIVKAVNIENATVTGNDRVVANYGRNYHALIIIGLINCAIAVM